MELSSSRITLQTLEREDLDFVHELQSLEETDQFNTLGIPANKGETEILLKKWLEDATANPVVNYFFVVFDNQTKTPVGTVGMKMGNPKYKRAEIWFKFHVSFWNCGFATESVYLLLSYGFETVQLHRIEAGCAVDNIGSIKVLEKSGFQREGRGRKVLPLKSGWSDNFEYGILETDYFHSKNPNPA